jgi:phosphoglycolate phosphatase-like HAD superfamily hydrolase
VSGRRFVCGSRAEVATVCVLSRGFSAEELRDARAAAVFESIEELRERLDKTALG